VHLKKVLFFGLRSDKRIDIGRSLGCRNEAGLIMTAKPYHVGKVWRYPGGRAEKCKLVHGY
jgi:hypothetical protein